MAAAVCVAPATALLGGEQLVRLAQHIAVGVLPVGLHTYVPAITMVGRPAFVSAAAALAVVAALLVLAPARSRHRGRRGSRSALFLLQVALMQLVFYLAQAGLIAAVSGLPDSASAALAASTLVACLWVALALIVKFGSGIASVLGTTAARRAVQPVREIRLVPLADLGAAWFLPRLPARGPPLPV